MIAIVITVVIVWAAILTVVIGMFRVATDTPTPQPMRLMGIGRDDVSNEPTAAPANASTWHGPGSLQRAA